MFETRYCDHDLFDILIPKKNGNLLELSSKDFRRNRPTIKSIKVSENENVVRGFCIKGNIHVLINRKNKLIIIKKYLQNSKTWKTFGDLKCRHDFCASSFIGKIYIIGGKDYLKTVKVCTSCVQYDTNTTEINEIAQMNQTRLAAASTVYDGKIVVSGGMVYNGVQRVEETNTVETYDHIADTWTYMHSMVERRHFHSLVSMKSKLFAIGNFYTGEVYDKVTNKFTLIKRPTSSAINGAIQASLLGNEIVAFTEAGCTLMFYDTGKNEWCNKTYEWFDVFGCTTFVKIIILKSLKGD